MVRRRGGLLGTRPSSDLIADRWSIVMREGVGYMMLLGQFPKVTVDIVGVAVVTFVVVTFGGRETSG